MSLQFLRPMALPRPSTINRFLGVSRLSTATTAFSNTTASSLTPLPSSTTLTDPEPKPYRVTLTPSKQYPVYTLRKRGGNMKLTRVKGIEGNLNILRDELQESLGMSKPEVVINQLTRHIIVKGHKKPQIEKFLKELDGAIV